MKKLLVLLSFCLFTVTACQPVAVYTESGSGPSIKNCRPAPEQCKTYGLTNCQACCAQRCDGEASMSTCVKTYCKPMVGAVPPEFQ